MISNPRKSIHLESVVFVLILAIGTLVGILNEVMAHKVNGAFGFPLDDPWIHLQFARNLHDYGKFSYFRGEMVTSGSTSPLYTILLSLGMYLTNQYLLLTYIIGIACLSLAAVYYYKINRLKITEWTLVAAGMWLVLFNPKLQWLELSGMETTLFIFLILAATYFYQTKQKLKLGIVCGLLIWTRPDALIFFVTIGADLIYEYFIQKQEGQKHSRLPLNWLVPAIVITIAFTILYGFFNYQLSGSFLPNTYAAKLKFYAGHGSGFGHALYNFLSEGPFQYFRFLVLIGLGFFVVDIVRRKKSSMMIPVVFTVLMIAAYWWKLPYLYQRGRYLMPIVPFLIMIGFLGFQRIFELVKPQIRKVVSFDSCWIQNSLLILICVSFSSTSIRVAKDYAMECRAILNRQVKAAMWERDHLAENAIIAAHDVGAQAYYSERKIVDMVGLVSPEMISGIGDPHKLEQFLQVNHVTHIAALDSWFDIVNIDPIFHTSKRYAEVMYVYPYIPGKTHIISPKIAQLTDRALHELLTSDFASAKQHLIQASEEDPQSSKVHVLLGELLLQLNDSDGAEKELRSALQIYPGYAQASTGLAEISFRRGLWSDAEKQLLDVIRYHQNFPPAYKVLSNMYATELNDPVKAASYNEQYEALIDQGL